MERARRNVTTVRSGDTALKLTKLGAFDLVNLDILRRVMNGLQALHWVRAVSEMALCRARKLDTAMQMRGEDEAEAAHNG